MTKIGLAALVRNYQSGMTFAELAVQHTPVNALSPDEFMERLRHWVVSELDPVSPGVYYIPADLVETDDEPGSDSFHSLFHGLEGYIDQLLPPESIRLALPEMTSCKYGETRWSIGSVWLDATEGSEYDTDTNNWIFRPGQDMRPSIIKLQALPRGNLTRHSCHLNYMQAVHERLHNAGQTPTLAQVMAFTFLAHNKRATLSPLFHAWAEIASTT